ncbi:MAG: TetR/AcrR family transcriptional regulator [Paracoccaceae bacterium]|nr:TetR/AcrR family transcriptional regulator [Paracoccaceae bacterium]MDG2258793.1 TetR/AcrR family transcriptional regulator [Paracoccaceae bacterium]
MARTSGSHAGITGPKVQQAALKLFAQNGYAAVSMRQIAAEVGVQAGALYNYTPDKQSLLFDLLKGHMDDLLAARAKRSCDEDARSKLEDFVRFHIRFHHARGDAVFISYMELRNLTPDNFQVIEGMRREYEAELQGILDQGVSENVFRLADAKITSLAIIAMLTGVNTWYRATGRLTLSQVEEIYLGMVTNAVARSS